jgi:hypothetical protein
MQDSKTGNLARNRIIYWKRITNTPVPSRWRALGRPWRIDGFYTFTEEDYTKTWSTDAKRKLNHWRNMHAHKHRIEKISFEEYSTAYTHSTVAKKVGTDLLHILERKLTLPQCAPHIELWGVRNSAGTIIAGTGILYSPTAYASVREAPFVCKDQTHTGVVAALMEHWFAQSRERGMDRVVSTHFWQKGDPTGWKGFSLFKSRFGFSFVAYPPALWRFVPGKFF